MRRQGGGHDRVLPQVGPERPFAERRVLRGVVVAHGLQVLLRHLLPPLPREPLGGSSGLVNIGVTGDLHDYAVRPCDDLCEAVSNVSNAAGKTAFLDDR